ncbi:MAG: NAD(P)-dependent oxidoreductase [Nocardioidaceae bacterium]|nr:NAD(P)-dependent oxidoreductase [Nocardioidaceae bacterium]NUS49979.1 NAD(P)-dependent oxidoreductase [Nocardioidaceae bacterium]
MSDQPTVALLGIGTMGDGMARNIAGAGLPLRVWNRTRSKAEPLADVGAVVAADPAEAVRGADVVVTMLFDTDSVETAMREARDGLGDDVVWVQQATVGVPGAERLARLADELGLGYVDAPVLGTKKPAADGALVILASGPEDLRDRVTPVFEAIGQRTLWVGTGQQGTRLKLVANSWVLTVLEGIAEALTFAKALDLDPRLFLEAVKGGAMDAPYVGLKGAAMLEGEFAPAFALDGAAKDAALMREAAEQAGVDVPIVEVAQRYLDRASADGHGADDMAAIFLAH